MFRHITGCSLLVLITGALSIGVFATDAVAANAIYSDSNSATDDPTFGVDISLERQHQEFTDTSADLDTAAITPHVIFSNWDFALYMPWQHADGDYFVNGFQPQATQICQRLGNLSATAIKFLSKRGYDLDQLQEFCSSEGVAATSESDSNSGLGDLSISAHYNMALDDAALWVLSVGAAYKWDNGDAETGLGSGTREPSVDASIGIDTDHWRASASASYAMVDNTESDEDLNNYASATLDAAWKALSWLAIGAAYDVEQSYVPDTDDITSTALYIALKPADYLRVTLERRDYLDTEGFPDREYTGRVMFLF